MKKFQLEPKKMAHPKKALTIFFRRFSLHPQIVNTKRVLASVVPGAIGERNNGKRYRPSRTDPLGPMTASRALLHLLFLVEMWDRMSYCGMRALLVLCMTAATTAGGLG